MDRTEEFRLLVGPSISNVDKKSEKNNRSAFYAATADIGKEIQVTSQMLSQLTRIVRRQGLFDDSSNEVDNMIMNIKQQLQDLNSKCDQAQTLVGSSSTFYSRQTQKQSHSGTVMNQLKADLMSTTKDFKEVLEMRTKKMKQQNQRKVELTGNGPLSPLKQLAAMQQQERSSANAVAAINPYSFYGENEVGDGDIESQALLPNAQRGLLLVAPSADTAYYDSRERAVNEVEKTIAELGNIFQRLSSMISEQQEFVDRIDADIEEAQENANRTKDYLASVYNSVSSNRGMMMKLGGIALLFIVLFVVFLM